jgi:cyclohexadieny/prephenate dehydrogenase
MTDIGIIGIGCIGSSLARDFKALGLGRVLLCDQNPEYLEQAEALGLGDDYFEHISDMAGECDVIFISVPVIHISDVLVKTAHHAKRGAILTDVGSVKASIIESVVDRLPDHVCYIPGHPITSDTAGSGPEAGRRGVFENTQYLLTPLDDTPLDALEALSSLLHHIGAETTIMDAHRHDVCLGFTSHLPHVIAFAMMNSSAKLSAELHEDVTKYAGGSFRDLTRVADSDIAMWRDIFRVNKEHLKELCGLFVSEISMLQDLVERDDAAGLEEFIKRAHDTRRRSLNT